MLYFYVTEMKSVELDLLHLCTPDNHIHLIHINSDLKYSEEKNLQKETWKCLA